MSDSGVQFEKWFKKAFELYKASAGILIVSTLLAYLVSTITALILAGPMLAGLVMIGLRVHDRSDPAPQVGDLFKGFDHFKDAFLLALTAFLVMFVAAVVLNWIPVIGTILFYALSSLIGLTLWFAMALVVEKGMDFWPAAQAAMEKIKKDPWAFLGFAILASLLGGIGALACVVGLIVTMPFYVCAVVVAYRETWSDGPAEIVDAPVPDAPLPTPESETAVSDETIAAPEPDAEEGQDESGEGDKPPAPA